MFDFGYLCDVKFNNDENFIGGKELKKLDLLDFFSF